MQDPAASPTSPTSQVPEGVSVGSVVAEFAFSTRRRLTWAALGIVCLAAGVALLAWSWLVREFPNPTTIYQARFIGFLAAGCGGFLVINAVRARHVHAWAGTEGVALLEKASVQSCRWEEIVILWESRVTSASAGGGAAVIQALARGESHVLTVECRDGRKMVFKSFLDNLRKLAAIITRETLPHLLPGPSATLEGGHSVQFGPLAINVDGITRKDGQRLPWSEVKAVTVKDGVLKVSTPGKWISWFCGAQGQIPNLHVFMALVKKYHNAQGATEGKMG
jgi:hypothetical protein